MCNQLKWITLAHKLQRMAQELFLLALLNETEGACLVCERKLRGGGDWVKGSNRGCSIIIQPWEKEAIYMFGKDMK